MYCIKCGAELVDNARFCPMCGSAVAVPVQNTSNTSETQSTVQTTETRQAASDVSPAQTTSEDGTSIGFSTNGFTVNTNNTGAYKDDTTDNIAGEPTDNTASTQATGASESTGALYMTGSTTQTDAPDTTGATVNVSISKDSLGIVLKIFGWVAAAYFAYLSVNSALSAVSGLFSIITSYRHVFYFFAFIAKILYLASNVVLCVGFLEAGAFYDKKKSVGAYSLAVGGLAVRLIYMVYMTFFLAIAYHRIINVGWQNVLIVIIFLAVLFGLYYAMGTAPYMNMSKDEIMAEIKNIPDFLQKDWSKIESRFNKNKKDEEQPQMVNGVPVGTKKLKTGRSLVVYILLCIITLGIYNWFFIHNIASSLNKACTGDGKKTGGFIKYFLLDIVTFGIYSWFWYYGVGNRLSNNADRYGIKVSENGTTVLLWKVVGVLLLGIGHLVAVHIICKNTNAICRAYNQANGL